MKGINNNHWSLLYIESAYQISQCHDRDRVHDYKKHSPNLENFLHMGYLAASPGSQVQSVPPCMRKKGDKALMSDHII